MRAVGGAGEVNLQEAAVWIDGLFPGEVSIEQVGDFHVASFATDGQFMASTLDFHDVDTGLVADGQDIRVELFAVANDPRELKELVSGTASMLRDTNIVPQPGEVAPGVGKALGLTLSAPHALLVVPFPWGGDVPHFKDAGLTTLMLQILPLTNDELAYLQTYGLAELQKALVEQGIDVLDLRRGA
ncbi:suppressor of fused domain protein [Corynebacterium hindlerae]|uniref:suppressor of fused domain protein n=1 Tax=Corynebacterium hindlerae TaxID=699041 RepID=UPI0031B6DB98